MAFLDNTFFYNTLLRAFSLVAALSLGLSACSSPRQATIDYDRNVNFQQYQTYGFYQPVPEDQTATEPQPQTPGTEPLAAEVKAADLEAKAYTTLLDQHFKTAINAEMVALGYQYSEQNPQLLVNYMTNVETRSDVRSSPFSINAGYGYYSRSSSFMFGIPLFGNRLEKNEYKVGTVTIDVIDAAEQRLVWQGLVDGRLTKKAMAEPQQAISDAVQLIYQRYPTRLKEENN
ncbi:MULTISPECIES: DUF4136 domain-containing protein [unclassified Arsukibacterium]|uniref:DUF4136 domain-containing protein n=1 Tax=unclassified Arsukibacterium TaxID=2635278 RepID=UPI000C5460FE|nr:MULTISPECIES: DUF4136 domain-containing protein [unclassified Arsukibacterium]MBM35027.1 hypothetical protein [Rheinheimera sp.]|tara:strand:+ start:24435 stop:25127 length:693 start_codon:yes stop_codon:yes gene_type:complete